MGVARVRPSRFIYTKELTADELSFLNNNTGNAKLVTYGIGNGTLPDRGLIHRIVVTLRSKAAFADSDNDVGCWLLHTSGTASSNTATTSLSDAESLTIIGQASYNPLVAQLLGSEIKMDSDRYVWSYELNFGQAILTGVGGSGTNDPLREAYTATGRGEPIYYDVSANVLGPAANTGTLYMSLMTDGTYNYVNNLTDSNTTGLGLSIRLEIEPCF